MRSNPDPEMPLAAHSALVLFSGGQDSAACLSWALTRFDHVETVGFHYGQRHDVEMTCRQRVLEGIKARFPDWATRLGPDHLVSLASLGEISDTALTRQTEIMIETDGLPNTFVPGRNLAFLVFAGAVAWRRGINTLVGGMCQTDFSGYPDCRKDTLDAQVKALALGLDRPIRLETPLMHLTKAETWALTAELGGQALVDLVVEDSHTCYRGDRSNRFDWGYGCGNCPACDLRARGWQDWQAGLAVGDTR